MYCFVGWFFCYVLVLLICIIVNYFYVFLVIGFFYLISFYRLMVEIEDDDIVILNYLGVVFNVLE